MPCLRHAVLSVQTAPDARRGGHLQLMHASQGDQAEALKRCLTELAFRYMGGTCWQSRKRAHYTRMLPALRINFVRSTVLPSNITSSQVPFVNVVHRHIFSIIRFERLSTLHRCFVAVSGRHNHAGVPCEQVYHPELWQRQAGTFPGQFIPCSYVCSTCKVLPPMPPRKPFLPPLLPAAPCQCLSRVAAQSNA